MTHDRECFTPARGAPMSVQGEPFIAPALAQTMLRDFDRHRKAVASGDFEAIQQTWDKCERWVSCIDPSRMSYRA